jgi:1-acyl-sn-glycerol-3-phosphate acyltransferase
LIRRYFTEPYRFIPPYRSTRWCRVFSLLLPRHLRRRLGVHRWHFEGTENLVRSLRQSAGIILAANHCRWADPGVLAMLGISLKRYFYYLVSYHLFKQGKFSRWYLNRIGAFSIWREGADREGLRAAARVVADAERPLVLFPEGTWFRQNDRLGPIQDGVSLIARQAARHTDRPIVIHPVSIKYWHLEDPRPALSRLLEVRERALGWAPQRHLDPLDRVEKLGDALLAIKEIEHFGRVGAGEMDQRLRELADAHVAAIEKDYLGRTFDGLLLDRIRRLRQVLARKLVEGGKRGPAADELRHDLERLLFCENLGAHSLDYLHERPSFERLSETVLRIEETVTDEPERPAAALGAVVSVGRPLDVRDLIAGPRRNDDFLVRALGSSIQQGIDDLLAKGPPAEWGCPSPMVSPPRLIIPAPDEAQEAPPRTTPVAPPVPAQELPR